jgi:hypothetical protein
MLTERVAFVVIESGGRQKLFGVGTGGAIGGVVGALVGGPIGAAIGAGVSGWLGHRVAAYYRTGEWSWR